MDPLDDGVPEWSFLDARFDAFSSRSAPVNMFALSGFPRWETVASNVLAFFLDPRERHGFKSAFADALVSLLDGAPWAEGPSADSSSTIDAANLRGARDWVVTTEVATREGNRIDILATSESLDVAIVIENKVDAAVRNPLDTYVERAKASASSVACVVLAPTFRAAGAEDETWVTAFLTYDDVFDSVFETLDASGIDTTSRSYSLLEQFAENLGERYKIMDNARDAATLDSYWSAIEGRESQIPAFFQALTRVNDILRARARALLPRIEAQLEARGLLGDSSLRVGMDNAWGRSNGRVTAVFLFFELVGGKYIELVLGHHPASPTKGFAVKAYPLAQRPNDMYSDFQHVALAAKWEDSDDYVVECFLDEVERLRQAHGDRAT